jgi:hypothetical protein
MGLLDHRRQWQYIVNAPAAACVDAFTEAFAGRATLVANAEWTVRRTGGGAVAVYEGRKGLAAVVGAMNKVSALEHDTARGSEVKFDAEPGNDGRSVCSMHLALSGRAGIAGLLGVTSDARFIRPYMQRVTRAILTLDPSAEVTP